VTLRRDVPWRLDLDQLRVRTPAPTRWRRVHGARIRTLIPKLGDLTAVGVVSR